MSSSSQTRLIDGQAKTVQQVFTGVRYGLDFYQREYRWTEKEVSELIEDLSTRFLQEYREGMSRKAVAQFAPYFLGPFVVSTSDGVSSVVDGQQRLTTLTLLLIHLNTLAAGREGAQTLTGLYYSQEFGEKSFTIDVDDRAEVMRALVDGTVFDPDASGVGESSRNIWYRYRDIENLFPEELAGAPLLHFVDWLLRKVVLVEVGTNDQNMALSIFETMNDRGQRLTNTDMLKSYLVASVGSEQRISAANQKWRKRVEELASVDRNADAEFFKTWLRAQHAETIRERKKDAVPLDFDIIGTAFHKWVRDNHTRLGLLTEDDFDRFLRHDFDVYSRRYMELLRASSQPDSSMPSLFHNACNSLTLQYLPILAAVRVDDDDQTFRQKAQLVASYMDLMLVRRMVNNRNSGYSTIQYTVFNLTKDLRGYDTEGVREVLADRVAGLEEDLSGVSNLGLNGRNRSHIAYLLARMTDWLEDGFGAGFAAYMGRGGQTYEVEHIWADHPERHADEFPNATEFAAHRNKFGDLLLLPKSFNASYGDKDYAAKRLHYFGQNMLAKSLDPRAYTNNPAFLSKVSKFALPFTAYPDGFKAADIDSRQELYRALCEVIWSPERLGLAGGSASKQPRNYYVAFADDDERSWEDAVRYGFLAAGGGHRYSDKLRLPRSGDRVFAYIPGAGYVGVGVVRQERVPAHDLKLLAADGSTPTLGEMDLKATRMWEHRGDPERQQYAIGVEWLATESRHKALKDPALFSNQTIVCRLKDPATVEAVEKYLGLAEPD